MNRFLSALMIVVFITFIVACSGQTGSSEQSCSEQEERWSPYATEYQPFADFKRD